MRQFTLLLFFMSSVLFCFGQNVYTINDIEQTTSGFVSKKTKKLLNGELKQYYSTGKLKEVIPFKNGVQDGVGKLYYQSGELEKKLQYKNNKFHGFYKEYHKNGKLKTSGWYENGLEEGVWKSWDQNGKLSSEFDGFKNGKSEGVMIWYYSWGEIKSIYKNDKLISRKCFDTRGNQIECE